MTPVTAFKGDDAGRRPNRRRGLIVVLITLALLVFAGANIHLVYVAVTSQPDCVDHLKTSGATEGTFRAARSSC